FFYVMVVGFSLDHGLPSGAADGVADPIAASPMRPTDKDPKFSWLAAAIIVGSLACIGPFAKRGGTYNSMLLAFAPMTAFCIAGLGWLFDRLSDPNISLAWRILASIFAAATIRSMTLSTPKSDLWNFTGANGDKTYSAAFHAAAKLDGTVICF